MQNLLGHGPLEVFNVLDKGQGVMDIFSESDGLRSLIREWTRVLLSIIVSATRLSMRGMEVSYGSAAVAKEDGRPPPRTITDTGVDILRQPLSG